MLISRLICVARKVNSFPTHRSATSAGVRGPPAGPLLPRAYIQNTALYTLMRAADACAREKRAKHRRASCNTSFENQQEKKRKIMSLKERPRSSFCCRYSGASAAAYARDQQEDDRGLEGLLRIVGKGANSPQHNQRSVSLALCLAGCIYVPCVCV